MTDPEAHAALAAALAAVQAELPEVKKTRTAKVEKDGRLLYTYDYADLADASAAILPILGKHGLSFTTFPGHQENGKFGLRYWLLHKGGGRIEGFFEIEDKGGMQLVGGRITYARRYCLCAVTGIAAEDDVDAREDGNGNGRKMQRRQPPDEGERQPQRTAQRKPRAVGPAPAQRDEGNGLPPLPGEDDPPPDSINYSSPGTVTKEQLTRIWATLTSEFGFAHNENDIAREACARIAGREVASSKELSFREAGTVIDALAGYAETARRQGRKSREVLADVIGLATPTPGDDDPRAAVLAAFDALKVAGPEIPGYLTRLSGHPYASVESMSRKAAQWAGTVLGRIGSRDELEAAAVAAEARREQDHAAEAGDREATDGQ